MFHSPYQRLTQLGLREKWRVHSALWSLEPGLPDKIAAVEAYMVAQLVGAAAPPIPGTSREIENTGPGIIFFGPKDSRQIRSMLQVNKELEASESRDGHGDGFCA